MTPSRSDPADTVAGTPPNHNQDTTGDSENEDDPVTAEYDVYITAPLPQSSLYLLQFPTREREYPYNAETANAPLELRLKSRSGFLEMDVPMNNSFHFDMRKAQKWGAAMAKAKVEGVQGYGIAAGFANHPGLRATSAARGAASRRRSGPQLAGETGDEGGQEHLMEVQTLGGQIVEDERGRPNYMIGAFRGSELHLTPVNGIVQMRPQFHHIDAKNLVDRNSLRRSREAAGDVSSARPAEPRLVQMVPSGTASTTEAENLDDQSESTKESLAKAMEEEWTRLEWMDEESENAYEAWHEYMFLKDITRAPRLFSRMGDEEYLDAISAPRLDPSGRHILRPIHRKNRAGHSGPRRLDQEDEDEDGVTAGEETAEEDEILQEGVPVDDEVMD